MWYLVLRAAVKPRAEWTVSLNEHLSWIKQQHISGSILFSGPSPDRDLGIYVIRADSRETAEKIAADDPFTKAGCCSYDLIPWNVRQVLGAGIFERREPGANRP